MWRSRVRRDGLSPCSPISLAGRPTTPAVAFNFAYYNTERLVKANADNQPPMPIVVDPARFELATFSMPLRRAPNCAMGPFLGFRLTIADWYVISPQPSICNHGGPEGIRTPDLLSAIEARSQLRYRPDNRANGILTEATGNVKQIIFSTNVKILYSFYIFPLQVCHSLFIWHFYNNAIKYGGTMNKTKTNFLVDIAAFSGLMIALEPRLTGVAIHEWLALALSGTLVVHLLLHWDWVVGMGKRFFDNVFQISRVNLVVDSLALISFIVALLSGLVISKVVMPAFGLSLSGSFSWRGIHSTFANLTLLLAAVHFALHWDWIKNVFERYIIVNFTPRELVKSVVNSSKDNQK
jgi:hypothetical protein